MSREIDKLSRKVSRKTEIELNRKMEMRNASRSRKWKYSEFWKSSAKIMKIFAPESRTKGVQSQRKGNVWVIGVRLLPILNENLENCWQLVLWFMVISSFWNPVIDDFQLFFKKQRFLAIIAQLSTFVA